MKILFIYGLLAFLSPVVIAQTNPVPASKMQQVFNEVKTPYKYGLVLTPDDKGKWWIARVSSDIKNHGI